MTVHGYTATWGTMQHLKPMWDVWKRGGCCSSQNEQRRNIFALFANLVKLQLIIFMVRVWELFSFLQISFSCMVCVLVNCWGFTNGRILLCATNPNILFLSLSEEKKKDSEKTTHIASQMHVHDCWVMPVIPSLIIHTWNSKTVQ